MGHWGQLLRRVAFCEHCVAEPGKGLAPMGDAWCPLILHLLTLAKCPSALANEYGGLKVPLEASGRSSSVVKGTPEQ